MIAPHRYNRKKHIVTQDGRPLRRYKRRWTVERTISWFQNFRRLCIRYEKSTMLIQGFLHLGCSIILTDSLYTPTYMSWINLVESWFASRCATELTVCRWTMTCSTAAFLNSSG